jgi:leucyl aminopeptidase
MKVDVRQSELPDLGADLIAVGLRAGDDLPPSIASANGGGETRSAFKELSLLRPDDTSPVLVVGLGERDELDAEKLRVTAAVVAKEAGWLRARSLAWVLPGFDDPGAAAEAVVTGTVLGAYRFDRFRAADPEQPPRLESLTLVGPADLAAAAKAGRTCAEAQNRARDLQSTPANVATPAHLAARAGEIAAAVAAVSVEVLGPTEIEAKGMGASLP